VGLDRAKESIRTFRLDRIVSEVSVSKKVNTFDIPEPIPSQVGDETTDFALLRVRKNRGHQLRSLGLLLESEEEWDQVRLPVIDSSWLLRTILWHRDDVIVLEPTDLRERVIDSLKELRAFHG